MTKPTGLLAPNTTVRNTDKHSQLILAAEASCFGDLRGFIPCGTDDLFEVFQHVSFWLGPRKLLEVNPAFRQIIPYVIVQAEDHVLRYRRSASGGEQRLAHKSSIGVGGHIDLVDVIGLQNSSLVDMAATLDLAALRELEEELSKSFVATCRPPQVEGVLLLDDTEVDRVHMGVVMSVRSPLSRAAIKSAEPDLTEFSWMPFGSLAPVDTDELWTKAILENYEGSLL